jgi:site-specific DNA recombinase
MGQQRAAIYCRISHDKEGAGMGVARQERECRALAKQRDLRVVDVYTDNDISAYSGRKREHYQRLLLDIEAGRVDVVLAWHTDRLHRRLRDLLDYTDLVHRRGVPTHCVKAGELDLSTAQGRMNAKLGAMIAENEIERGIERARSKRAEMADNGAYRGGTRPFGFERDGVTVREAEAAELREAASRVLAKDKTVAAVAADWNARGVTTSRGKSWSGPRVRRLLIRARNAARIEHHGEVIGAATWPAILDETTWTGLRATLGNGAPTYRQAPRAQRLLSGVARCGVAGCGAYLIGSGSSQAGTHRRARHHARRSTRALPRGRGTDQRHPALTLRLARRAPHGKGTPRGSRPPLAPVAAVGPLAGRRVPGHPVPRWPKVGPAGHRERAGECARPATGRGSGSG